MSGTQKEKGMTTLEFTCSLDEARQFLYALHSVMQLLQLYEQCFPEAFQRDLKQGASILPEAHGYYSQCETNFFHLVNTHYFPLPIDFFPEDEFGERMLAERIPVEAIYLSFDSEYQEYDELSLGWKLLLYLLNPREEERLRLSYDGDDDLFALPLRREGRVSEQLLDLRCSAQGGMLAHLALAAQVITNATESVWLNVTLDEPCLDAYWTKDDMEALKEEYQLGLDIRAKADAFCAWLEEDPSRHFSLVVRLWNSCILKKPEKRMLQRKLKIPGGTCSENMHQFL